VASGAPDIDDWAVGPDPDGTLVYIGTAWTASEGTRSLDLSRFGGTPGEISQLLPTEVGVEYTVLLDIAGNPDCGTLGPLGSKLRH
jgi:hypothetical protein